jgi:hypothetical protein
MSAASIAALGPARLLYTGGMERMENPAVDLAQRFTYRHYKTWPDEERWELIEGQARWPSPTSWSIAIDPS